MRQVLADLAIEVEAATWLSCAWPLPIVVGARPVPVLSMKQRCGGSRYP
jgi:hypothetical protein